MWIESPQFKRTVGWVAAFALPIAVVQVVGSVSGSTGPATLHAADITTSTGLTPSDEAMLNIMVLRSRPKMSPEEIAAQERLQILRADTFGPTPMFHTIARPATQTADNDPSTDGPQNRPMPMPNVQLQAIMSGSDTAEAMALINGRPHTAGQTIHGTDWILAEIHADERRIVLVHPQQDRTIDLTLRTP